MLQESELTQSAQLHHSMVALSFKKKLDWEEVGVQVKVLHWHCQKSTRYGSCHQPLYCVKSAGSGYGTFSLVSWNGLEGRVQNLQAIHHLWSCDQDAKLMHEQCGHAATCVAKALDL